MCDKKYRSGLLVMLIILWCCTACQVKDMPETSNTETETETTSDPAADYLPGLRGLGHCDRQRIFRGIFEE